MTIFSTLLDFTLLIALTINTIVTIKSKDATVKREDPYAKYRNQDGLFIGKKNGY